MANKLTYITPKILLDNGFKKLDNEYVDSYFWESPKHDIINVSFKYGVCKGIYCTNGIWNEITSSRTHIEELQQAIDFCYIDKKLKY